MATYRLQFRKGMTFARARRVLPYLRELGVTDVYLSPVLKARHGSAHGYDVVDPTRLDPVLGDIRPFAARARELGLGIVLDIVPNHMSASDENLWWRDVLRRGRSSRWAHVFDAEWDGAGRVARYRRFFDIDDLVGVRVEDPDVFEATHAKVLELAREGVVTGLRVDHVDGLWDPLAYLRRLRREAKVPVWVEKILAPGEELPSSWPVEGTTGYDFLNVVNGLFLTRSAPGFTAMAIEMKRLVLRASFAAEVRALSAMLGGEVEDAIIEVTARLPVYRTYVRPRSAVGEADRRVVRSALRGWRPPAVLRRALLEPRVDFVMRWQQLTGAAAAKGVEDTAMYRVTDPLAACEVGADPGRAPVSVPAFHRFMATRSRRTMNATSTHDAKRSEDVRARLSLIDPADLPVRTNDPMHAHLVQTLVGAWPVSRERMHAYAIKAAREAKEHTSWAAPDEAYEGSMFGFVDTLLADERLVAYGEPIGRGAAVRSLAQVLVKITAPGRPDVYQGTEVWRRMLVDPDNRGSVDFTALAASLRSLRGADPRELLDTWQDGRIKQFVTWKALTFRRDHAALFDRGAYIPLRAPTGVCAFARRHRRAWAVVAVPVREGARGDVRPPTDAPTRWTSIFTGAGRRSLSGLFADFPVALLASG